MFSRFLKVAQPKNVKSLLGQVDSKEEDLFYPIAFFGAYFDVPEMSYASLDYVSFSSDTLDDKKYHLSIFRAPRTIAIKFYMDWR